MQAFYSRFGDLAFRETRSITVSAGYPMPADEYGFIEYYCTDKKCDCRRVMIKVMGQHSGNKVWATISYGWENTAFYLKWSPGIDNPEELSRPTLDPLNPQSKQAAHFLTTFEYMIQDKTYVDRLKRHYKMFREFQKPPSSASIRKI